MFLQFKVVTFSFELKNLFVKLNKRNTYFLSQTTLTYTSIKDKDVYPDQVL